MSFSAFLTTPITWLEHSEIPKKILKYVIALDKIYILYQYHFGIWMGFILAKCWKSSEMAKITYFCTFY